MIITGTSDIIQFKLGSTASTQLPFTVDYNNYTSTGVSLITNNGTSNDTTAVSLVPSPSSNQQNELRYCSIYNAESATETVIIQVFDGTNTRVVFRAVLASGATLQYQLEKGWEVIDQAGNKLNSGIIKHTNSMNLASLYFRPVSATGTTTLTNTNGVWFYHHCGRVDKAYNTIKVQYRVTQAAASITYAEIAIYSGFIKTSEGTGAILGTRRGFADVSGTVNSLGTKTSTINVSGMTPGELFQIVLSVQATTGCIIRSMGITTEGMAMQPAANITLPNTGGRPSLVSTGQVATAIIPPMYLAWQGT